MRTVHVHHACGNRRVQPRVARGGEKAEVEDGNRANVVVDENVGAEQVTMHHSVGERADSGETVAQGAVTAVNIWQTLADDLPEAGDASVKQAYRCCPEIPHPGPQGLILIQNGQLAHAAGGGHSGQGTENVS